MILLVRGWRRLVATITAFTVAHSITFGMTVLDVVRMPGPPVEAFIALSIVYLAFEIPRLALRLRGRSACRTPSRTRRILPDRAVRITMSASRTEGTRLSPSTGSERA